MIGLVRRRKITKIKERITQRRKEEEMEANLRNCFKTLVYKT